MIGEIQYGVVKLKITKVNDVRKEVQFSQDGVDYLYTAMTIDVITVLNPAATSYSALQGIFPRTGEAWAGRTDKIISDYLAQPRRQLTMWMYDKDLSKHVYLESPPGDMACDAKNGPFCKVCSIKETHGSRTWILHLQFTTYINNCYDATSPILSHRWERNIDYDEQYRAVATTSGVVVFHAGRLFSENPAQSPDFYRHEFFQPPPENFAREHVNVNISSDNTTARYTVVDVERFFNIGGVGAPFGASEAVKIDATLQTSTTFGSLGNVLAQSAPEAGNLLGGLIPTAGEWAGRSGEAWLLRQGNSLWGSTQRTAATGVTNLPMFSATVSVRVHGARDSSRRKLADLAMAIAFSRLGDPTFWTLATRTEMVMHQDLGDTFVNFSMTLRWMWQTWVQIAGGFGAPFAVASALIPLIIDEPGSAEFFNRHLGAPRAGDPLGNNTYMARSNKATIANPANFPIGRALLDQGFDRNANSLVSNRPMSVPSLTNRHNRSVGYLKRAMVQALGGQCKVPPVPGAPAYQADVWDISSGASTVRSRVFPLLPSA